MKIFLLTAAMCAATFGALAKGDIYKKGWIDFNKNGRMDTYENPEAPLEQRVADLVGQMTLEEKTCQMTTLYGSGVVLKDALPTPEWKNEIWKDGIGNIDEEHNGLGNFGSEYSFPYSKSVDSRHAVQRWFVEQTRLGIPVDFTNEGIRGLCHDRATSFPAQCGQGASWNRNLIAEIAAVEAREAKVLGYTNIYSPILDLAQDPRWGRVVECYGEDPFLAGELGVEMIEGLQSFGLVSSPKHFAVYSIPVGGRDGDTRTDPHVAPREMHTLYLEPFRKAFTEAGALGVMSSYNDYDGVPITGSYYFLTELLRNQWGFEGYVVSDSDAVEYLHGKHHVAADAVEGAAMAVNAGLNIRTNFTMPQEYILPLREAVRGGLIDKRTLDARVSEILRVKFRMGLFDNPYPGDAAESERIVHSPEHRAVSLDAARQSLVLIKNEGDFLPLDKSTRRIAVVGPNADEKEGFICRYGPRKPPIISLLEGVKALLPNAEVNYAKGCETIDERYPESELIREPLTSEEQAMIDEAVAAAEKSDVVILTLGGSEDTVRESRSRTDLDLPGRQMDLMQAIVATGKPVVLVLFDGRAATINYADKYIPAILHAWFPGEFGGQAVAEALFGDYNPGGSLPVTFPKSVGQIPFAFPFKPGSDAYNPGGVSGVLYPFGHGLSYTTFEYSDLAIDLVRADSDDVQVRVSAKVKNTGERAGDEVVQLYVSDLLSSVTTYTQVLRGFERVSLSPGESQVVEFTLGKRELGLIGRDNVFKVEPGEFTVKVGASSKDIRLRGKFEAK